MYKIGVLGDRESILGFKALGADVFSAIDAQEARQVLRRLAGGGYAVIFITEHLAIDLVSEIESYKDSAVPAVIIIPGKEGGLGIGMTNLKNAVERAVGINILNL